MTSDFSKFFVHYKIHQRWVYDAWKWLIEVDMEVQQEIDYRYYDYEDWLNDAWLWSPDWIKHKGTYSIGSCSECKYLLADGCHLCQIQPVDIQDNFYWNWESFKVITDKEIKNLACSLFEERICK